MKKYILGIFFVMHIPLFSVDIPWKYLQEIYVFEQIGGKFVIYAWLFTDELKRQAVLVKLINPQRESLKLIVPKDNIIYINPRAATEALPKGLYFWKGMQGFFGGFDEFRFPGREDRTIKAKHQADSEECFYKGRDPMGKPIFISASNRICEYDEEHPSELVKGFFKVLEGTIPKEIHKVKEEVAKDISNKINMAEKDLITQETFEDLAKGKFERQLPFIIFQGIAEVSGKLQYSYYNAEGITIQVIKEGTSFLQDPLTRRKFKFPFSYFITFSPQEEKFSFLSDARVWKRPEPIDIFIQEFLNQVFNFEGIAEEKKKIDLKKLENDYKKFLNGQVTNQEKSLVEDLIIRYFAAFPDLIQEAKKKKLDNLMELAKKSVEAKPEIKPIEPKQEAPIELPALPAETIKNIDTKLKLAAQKEKIEESINLYSEALELLKGFGMQGYTKMVEIYGEAVKQYLKKNLIERAEKGLLGVDYSLKEAERMHLELLNAKHDVEEFNKKFNQLEDLKKEVEAKKAAMPKEIIPSEKEKDLRSVYQSLSALAKELRMLEGQIRRVVR
jgi:hypothetical protein